MMEENKESHSSELMIVHLLRDEFAKKIGLGIPRSSTLLIEGEEGSGRSVVSQRLAFGLLENGFSVTYISTELTLKDFINQMYSMKYNIGPYLIKTKLKFIPVLPIIGETMPKEGYLQTLMDNPSLYATDVTIIDSFGEMLHSTNGTGDMDRFLEYMKKIVHGGKALIMTAHKGQPGIERLRQICDVYFELELKSSSYGIRHIIKVRRYLKAKGKVDKMVEFRVEPDVGLIIEITEVSG